MCISLPPAYRELQKRFKEAVEKFETNRPMHKNYKREHDEGILPFSKMTSQSHKPSKNYYEAKEVLKELFITLFNLDEGRSNLHKDSILVQYGTSCTGLDFSLLKHRLHVKSYLESKLNSPKYKQLQNVLRVFIESLNQDEKNRIMPVEWKKEIRSDLKIQEKQLCERPENTCAKEEWEKLRNKWFPKTSSRPVLLSDLVEQLEMLGGLKKICLSRPLFANIFSAMAHCPITEVTCKEGKDLPVLIPLLPPSVSKLTIHSKWADMATAIPSLPYYLTKLRLDIIPDENEASPRIAGFDKLEKLKSIEIYTYEKQSERNSFFRRLKFFAPAADRGSFQLKPSDVSEMIKAPNLQFFTCESGLLDRETKDVLEHSFISTYESDGQCTYIDYEKKLWDLIEIYNGDPKERDTVSLQIGNCYEKLIKFHYKNDQKKEELCAKFGMFCIELNLDPMASANNFESLKLFLNEAEFISYLSFFPNLQKLILGRIIGIEMLDAIPVSLKELEFSINELTDFSDLTIFDFRKLNNLKKLNIFLSESIINNHTLIEAVANHISTVLPTLEISIQTKPRKKAWTI